MSCETAAPSYEEEVGASAQEILEGTRDTNDLIRATVWVNGCSGSLLSQDVVLSAAHCFGRATVGCDPPYAPAQATPGDINGDFVKVPPVGSYDFNHANAAEYAIAAHRSMPSVWPGKFGELCCPSGPVGCAFCATGTSMFQKITKSNHFHDLAVVYLDSPIVGITPDKAILHVDSSLPPSEGGYDFSPAALEDATVVMAGTSYSTQDLNGRERVYGSAPIASLGTPGSFSPHVFVDDSGDCSLGNPPTVSYDGYGAALSFTPATSPGACFVPGDSGGPTYFNAPSLGGDDLSNLLGTSERLVGGVHSGGDAAGATTCSTVTSEVDVSTWNLLYTYDDKVALGQNGDFIGQAVKDFDGDGFPNETDNCPVVFQENQDNCNRIAEQAKGFKERGDVCDPIPCAHGHLQPAKLTNVRSQGGSLIRLVTANAVRDTFVVEAVPSHHYFNGANNGEALEPLEVDDVTTMYRYCKNDGPLNVVCDDDSTVDSFFAGQADDTIGPTHPYLRAHVKEPNMIGATYHEEDFDYGSSPKVKRQWQYASDQSTWVGNGWVSIGALSGRLWLHSDTDVGQYATGSVTGYRVNVAGTTTGDDDLPNYYVPLTPQYVYIETHIGAWNPWPYFAWKDDWGIYGPAWDGLMEEASTIIKGHDGKLARITRTGAAVVIEDHLTTALKSLMAQGVVWEPAAEANLGQAHAGPDQSPHAVAFRVDGTDVQDGAWQVGDLRGTTSDASEPSLAKSGGPNARTAFTTVYSRADDLAFVVGGLWSSTPTREIWFRGVEGDIPWARVPLGVHTSYEPQHVRAATWSFREQMLWVLDHDGSGTARLARVHPFTGFATVVEEWDWTGEWDKHWMQLAPDGTVVLFASSTELNDHAVARFHVPPMVVHGEVTVTSLLTANGRLLYRPTIDPRGYTRIVHTTRPGVMRSDAVTGAAADLGDLRAML